MTDRPSENPFCERISVASFDQIWGERYEMPLGETLTSENTANTRVPATPTVTSQRCRRRTSRYSGRSIMDSSE